MNGEWTQSYLRSWEELVKRAEAGDASDLLEYPHDGGLGARDELEALIVRGGRRGRRLASVVAVLDDRFRKATVSNPQAAGGGQWWRGRHLD